MSGKTKIIVLLIVFIILSAPAFAQKSLSTYIGGAFYRYEEAYLMTGLTYLSANSDQMELTVGADFGIATTEGTAGEILPKFFIPVNVGINFAFPGESLTFYLGPGISPVLIVRQGSDKPFTFLAGPYAKIGVRWSVHTIMSASVEIQQDLLVGGPNWVNTATRILGGIVFSLK